MYFGSDCDQYGYGLCGIYVGETKNDRLARELMERREVHLNFLATLIKKITGSMFKLSIILILTMAYHKYTCRIFQYIKNLKEDEMWVSPDFEDAVDRIFEPEGNLLEVEE